ncbi:MAG: hypothetical protein WBP26_00820 [Candidatus Saccharimonadales bacterium]
MPIADPEQRATLREAARILGGHLQDLALDIATGPETSGRTLEIGKEIGELATAAAKLLELGEEPDLPIAGQQEEPPKTNGLAAIVDKALSPALLNGALPVAESPVDVLVRSPAPEPTSGKEEGVLGRADLDEKILTYLEAHPDEGGIHILELYCLVGGDKTILAKSQLVRRSLERIRDRGVNVHVLGDGADKRVALSAAVQHVSSPPSVELGQPQDLQKGSDEHQEVSAPNRQLGWEIVYDDASHKGNIDGIEVTIDSLGARVINVVAKRPGGFSFRDLRVAASNGAGPLSVDALRKALITIEASLPQAHQAQWSNKMVHVGPEKDDYERIIKIDQSVAVPEGEVQESFLDQTTR